MTQHSIKKGLKEFGEAGTLQAVLKDVRQLHDWKVLEPKGPNKLTGQERHDALRYIMLLTEKCCGTIEGCGCADGRKQREHILLKEETSSPTVAIESLMLPFIIDTKEAHDVATTDIPGAFMQMDMEGTVHMVLEGTMAELLVKIAAQIVPQAPPYKEKEIGNVHATKKGTVWNATGRASVLERPNEKPEGMGLQNKSV
jgi:hypothetical protein